MAKRKKVAGLAIWIVLGALVMAAIVMAVVTAVQNGQYKEQIVGTWQYTDEEGTFIYTFGEDDILTIASGIEGVEPATYKYSVGKDRIIMDGSGYMTYMIDGENLLLGGSGTISTLTRVS